MDWRNKPNQIFNKVKHQMFAKGVESFYFVDQFICQFDPEFTWTLTPHFFNLFMNKIGVFLSTQEIRTIKDYYTKEGNLADLIKYRDFLEDVKYSISEKVADLLNQAFAKLDPDNTRQVSLEHLTQCYHAPRHPHVLSRRKSPEEVANNFISGMNRKAKDGFVNKEGFIDYYAELNFCISAEREKYFEDLLTGTWQLVNPDEYVSPQRLHEIELILYEKIREKSNGKGGEWKTAKKAISFFDLADQGKCDFKTFRNSLDKFGCNFKTHEIRALFEKYDADKSGYLDYEEFGKLLMDMDISGMSKKPNLLTTLGSNHFKVTH